MAMIDFCDPLTNGECLLVITGKYSRYPVVEVIRGTTAKTVIHQNAERAFNIFGYQIR